VNTKQACPLPGQLLPPGHHGLFYVHNGYWCLNTGRYYGGIHTGLGTIGHWIAMVLLFGSLTLLCLAVAGAVAVAAVKALAGGRP
jgi:hypothetical protein